MKKRKVLAVLLCAAMTAALAVGCGGSKGSDSSDKSSDSSSSSDDVITVGFSQVGAESDWRTANSQSMKDTFSKENGYDLIFDDAQQKQENQITAIRNFIQQEVDAIFIAPVVATSRRLITFFLHLLQRQDGIQFFRKQKMQTSR